MYIEIATFQSTPLHKRTSMNNMLKANIITKIVKFNIDKSYIPCSFEKWSRSSITITNEFWSEISFCITGNQWTNFEWIEGKKSISSGKQNWNQEISQESKPQQSVDGATKIQIAKANKRIKSYRTTMNTIPLINQFLWKCDKRKRGELSEI